MISETRKRGNRFMLLGLALAVLSIFLITQYISQIKAEAAPPPTPTPEPLVAVIYVADTIVAQTRMVDVLMPPQGAGGEPIEAINVCDPSIEFKSPVIGRLQVCALPARFVASATVILTGLAPTELANADLVQLALNERLGRETTQVDMQRGSLLQVDALESNRAPAGMVEVGIGVDLVTSVGGRLRPGHRVDIVVSYATGAGDGKRTVTEYLLQDIEVVAVPSGSLRFEKLGQVQEANSDAAYAVLQEMAMNNRPLDNSVVLAVAPNDALQLIHMANFAEEVRLLLRSPSDHEIRAMDPVSIINN